MGLFAHKMIAQKKYCKILVIRSNFITFVVAMRVFTLPLLSIHLTTKYFKHGNSCSQLWQFIY